MNESPTCIANSVGFQTYTDLEILNLSVLEVTSPKTLNALGHPIPGGVYDRALGPPASGPRGSREVCSTCGGDNERCNGHIGHIKLPLAVINPLFAKTLYKILRGSCFNCHRLLASVPQCLLLKAQLTVLDYGLFNVAQQLMEEVSELMEEREEHVFIEIESILKGIVEDAMKDCDATNTQEFELKNINEYKQKLLKIFFKEHFVPKKKVKKCDSCKTEKRRIYHLPNNTFVLATEVKKRVERKSKKKEKKKQKNKEMDEMGLDFNIEEQQPEEMLFGQTSLTPEEVIKHLSKIWENENSILVYLFPALKCLSSPCDIFIKSVIPVPPPKFRPLNRVGDQKFENPQSLNLSRVVQSCIIIRHLLSQVKSGEDDAILEDDDVKRALKKINGNSKTEKLQSAWENLQNQVNAVLDNNVSAKSTDRTIVGVKQVIEKKEGLFRQNMMGKRVNYAARSVISPDPNISIDEIGIPEIIAINLIFPEAVTPWNVDELRKAVINGPNVYPGAAMVQNPDGTRFRLGPSELKREAIAKQLLTPAVDQDMKDCKWVYRHVINGDMLLVNRQPTLHKPSIMAHKARILRGEKTLRLHYSNCKTYNADFDGDEMNIHLPQTQIARAEAKMIANVTNQYLVPKDGTPLGGLIQDHMIAGVLMTVRGRFFRRDQYLQLVYRAIPFFRGAIKTLPPAIWKPCALWSGKQIISTVLINLIPAGKPLITLEGVTKIAAKSWQKSPPRPWTVGGKIEEPKMSESEFVIHDGELLCGVMDKAHYGPTPYGLVHCCYELYGGVVSSEFLSALGRLFTSFIQNIGFSLGAIDIMSDRKADRKREKAINKSTKVGNEVAAKALLVRDVEDEMEIHDKMESAHFNLDDIHMKALDMEMKSKTDELSNQISNIIMPNGLLKKFPENNLQLMVSSGAKGSSVNMMQISCSLGQIELEGRRPAPMSSGRPLPSFKCYDVTPKAGGYVAGRFATGIEPQEYFFHCMAGREGLVDTAVKTSRSGYLQRCLIKHLESLRIRYDLTVRDCDGSVIQFLYGEDGLDIQKSTFLQSQQLPFLLKNYGAIYNKKDIEKLKKYTNEDEIVSMKKSIKKWNKKHGNELRSRKSPFQCFSKKYQDNDKEELVEMWENLDEVEKQKFIKKTSKCPDPVVSKLSPGSHFGALVEQLDELIENYQDSLPSNYSASNSSTITPSIFKDTMNLKAIRSVCDPGEAVGLLAAQSVGEPSTQMTLNTFHFAGRGDMNVTLGIPRMREILMSASAEIATPSMEIPFLKSAEDKIEETKLLFGEVHLNHVIDKISLDDVIHIECDRRCRIYKIHFKFLRYKQYRHFYHTTPAKVLHYFENVFVKHFLKALKKKARSVVESDLIATESLREEGGNEDEGHDEENNEGDESGDEIDEESAAARSKKQCGDDAAYEEKEDEDEIVKEDEEEEDEMDVELSTTIKENLQETANNDGEGEGSKEENVEYTVKVTSKDKMERVDRVIGLHGCVAEYDFDTKKGEWCELSLRFELDASKVDIMSLLQEQCQKAVIYAIPSIRRAVLRKVKDEIFIKTDGVNIQKMFEFDNVFDVNRLYCNNIHLVARSYGIEAARRVIVKEIQDVFGVYGIQVDPRHLLLIADYMTFDGTYAGLNRFAMQTSTSPLQQMSFETTMHFLQTATLQDSKDTLKSPSAQLVVGKVVGMGTGSFDVIQKLC